MTWHPAARRSAEIVRRRNALLRRVFHPKDSIPKRVQRVYRFGDIEYNPSIFTPILEDRFARNRIDAGHRMFFGESTADFQHTPGKVRQRNVEPLLRTLEKSPEFEDAVKGWTGKVRIERADKQAFLISLFSRTDHVLVWTAVQREFGMPVSYSSAEDLIPGVQMVVRAVYNRTQLYFVHRRINSITVVRGMSYTDEEWSRSDFRTNVALPYQRERLRGLEDDLRNKGEAHTLVTHYAPSLVVFNPYYTALLDATRGHYGALFAGSFPVERVLSTAFTGWGRFPDRDYVVFGGPMQLAAKVWRTGAVLLDDLNENGS
jgi:hypothetical protein